MTLPKDNASDEVRPLLDEYEQFLAGKARGTTDAYLRTVRHLIEWVALRPGNEGHFQPLQLTKMAIETFLIHLEQEGLSINHRARVKSTISSFAYFLIEEKGLLQRNPTRGIDLPPVPQSASRPFSEDQRAILCSLVKQERDKRGSALFALGYWAGCRVSDISWLQMTHTHVDSQMGWLHVGDKGSKWRDIDLMDEARQPLYEYLQAASDEGRTYVFMSQRSKRLTEEGIYYWFRTLKAQAPESQRKLIQDLTFHDLQHDFAHRAREAGWSPEEVAYYLGRNIEKGATVIQALIGDTPVSREHIKRKFKDIKG
jgi:site-specific recombinase XerC